MLSKATFVSILATIAVLDPVSALGINCRGSGLCPRASYKNEADVSVMQGLRDAMYKSTADDSTAYNAGDHIICVSQFQNINVDLHASADVSGGKGGANVGVGASVSLGLDGKIGNGGICVFAQNTGLTLGDAKGLIDGLLQHGCTVCGSNPSKPGNNVATGMLTVNYVSNPFCIGNCLTAAGTGGSSKVRRWGKDGARVRQVEDSPADDVENGEVDDAEVFEEKAEADEE